MRGPVGWVACLALAACAGAPAGPRTRASLAEQASAGEPLRAGLVSLAAGRPEKATPLLVEAGERYPALADYALYFRARAVARAGRPREALALARELSARYPDSIWAGSAALLAGRISRSARDLPEARASLAVARGMYPAGSRGWVVATLGLAELEGDAGEVEGALDLARELRRVSPRSLGARRARRLATRLWRAHPELPVDHVEEAEMRLREGDMEGARNETEIALTPDLPPPLRARALWVRAHAEHGLGLGSTAEATCLALAREAAADPLAPRAISTAAVWRWNADDDEGASRLFGEVVRRFLASPHAAEALYGLGRIAQEGGRYEEARAAYAELAERFPSAELAPEARWRAAWVRYLAGAWGAAERAFARAAAREKDAARPAAEYWRARAAARLGREDEARTRFAHLVEEHSTSYYAGLAEERLGSPSPAGDPPAAVAPPPFPPDLPGIHAERARLLAGLGLRRFSRLELDALSADAVPRRQLLDAYRAIGAAGAALRQAYALGFGSSASPNEYLYPLGYWEVVGPTARARGLDPLLVAALIRQESLFDPEAVSAAGARGLMQLMPSTARRIAQADGVPAPTPAALQDVATNVALGVTHFARLLARYDGSAIKALAAYNGGEEAVAKWERRYAGREPDEFVELISFRETRDYVKAVLRNYRVYQRLYLAAR
jgi:soluble lytic murein transglycosylase